MKDLEETLKRIYAVKPGRPWKVGSMIRDEDGVTTVKDKGGRIRMLLGDSALRAIQRMKKN